VEAINVMSGKVLGFHSGANDGLDRIRCIPPCDMDQ
jgi:hypothetical protein